jgi:hypothetical protein
MHCGWTTWRWRDDPAEFPPCEIAAKAEDGASPTRMLLMIRALIEERFQLKLHRETVQGSIYDLELVKGGHRMRVAAPGSCVDIDSARGSPLPLCDIRQRVEERTRKLVATGEAMALFVGYLSWQLHWPVVDKTGLPGKYDFELKFVPDDLTPGIDRSRNGDRPLGPSLFEAISCRAPGRELTVTHVSSGCRVSRSINSHPDTCPPVAQRLCGTKRPQQISMCFSFDLRLSDMVPVESRVRKFRPVPPAQLWRRQPPHLPYCGPAWGGHLLAVWVYQQDRTGRIRRVVDPTAGQITLRRQVRQHITKVYLPLRVRLEI